MKFSKLNSFTVSLSKLLKLGTPFAIVTNAKGYTFQALTRKEYPKQLRSVLDFAVEFHHEVSIKDFYRISKEEMSTIILVDKFLKLYINKCAKIHSKGEENENFSNLIRVSLSLSLGAKIPVKSIDDIDNKTLKLIKANKFDEQALFLRIQFPYSWEEGIKIPIEIEPKLFHSIPANQLDIVEIRNDRRKLIGQRYYHKDKCVFETDANYKLVANYSFVFHGIAQYHIGKAFPLYPTLSRMPKKGLKQNTVEVRIFKGLVNKLALILKNEDGNVYFVGINQARISCPDPALLLSDNESDYDSFEISCKRDEIKEIKKQLEDKRFRLSAKRTDIDLLSVLAKCSIIPRVPMRPFVTENVVLSYSFLPFNLLFSRFYKRSTNLATTRDILLHPYKKYLLDVKKLKEILGKVSLDMTKKKKNHKRRMKAKGEEKNEA